MKRNQQVRILTLLVLDFQNLCFWFWCLLGTPQNFLFGNARLLLPSFIKSRCGTSYPVEILEKDQRKGCKFWKSYHMNYLEKVIYHSSTKMLSYLNLMSLFLSFSAWQNSCLLEPTMEFFWWQLLTEFNKKKATYR